MNINRLIDEDVLEEASFQEIKKYFKFNFNKFGLIILSVNKKHTFLNLVRDDKEFINLYGENNIDTYKRRDSEEFLKFQSDIKILLTLSIVFKEKKEQWPSKDFKDLILVLMPKTNLTNVEEYFNTLLPDRRIDIFGDDFKSIERSKILASYIVKRREELMRSNVNFLYKKFKEYYGC